MFRDDVVVMVVVLAFASVMMTSCGAAGASARCWCWCCGVGSRVVCLMGSWQADDDCGVSFGLDLTGKSCGSTELVELRRRFVCGVERSQAEGKWVE